MYSWYTQIILIKCAEGELVATGKCGEKTKGGGLKKIAIKIRTGNEENNDDFIT